jgi:hypothetical protein
MNALVEKNKRENLTPAEIEEYRRYERNFGYEEGPLLTQRRPRIAELTRQLGEQLDIVNNPIPSMPNRIVAMIKAEDLFVERQKLLREPAPLDEMRPPPDLLAWVEGHAEAIRRKVEERHPTTPEEIGPLVEEVLTEENAEFYAGHAPPLAANRGSPSLNASASASAAEEGRRPPTNFNSQLRAAGVNITVDPGDAGGAGGGAAVLRAPRASSLGSRIGRWFGLGGKRVRRRRTHKQRRSQKRSRRHRVKRA